MLELKNKNGITLIALIITIIVMLILVGVTVSVSLNGGLFDKAKEAGNQTQIAADAEALQAAALGAMGTDGKVDRSKITGFTRNEDGTFTSSNGYRFTVDDNGNVTYVGEGAGGGTVTEGKLGSYVTYKGLTWRVLKDDSSGVELLSDNAIGSYTFSGSDWAGGWPTSVWSLAEDINAECERATGISENIRNLKDTDVTLVDSLGMLAATNKEEYFIEAFTAETDKTNPNVSNNYTCFVNSVGDINQIYLFAWDEESFNYWNPTNEVVTKSVRPIVTLGAGALENITGTGTFEQPYILAH